MFGPNHSETLIERSYHASWVRELEGPEAASILVRDLVPAMVAEIGPTMGPTLISRNNLVGWLMESGRAAEAEAACREAVADLETYGSPPSMEADSLRFILAHFNYRAGHLAAAADGMAKALDRLSIPWTDPNALQARDSFAFYLWQDGRTAEALTTYQELLPDLTRILPAGHPSVMQTIQNIATLSDR